MNESTKPWEGVIEANPPRVSFPPLAGLQRAEANLHEIQPHPRPVSQPKGEKKLRRPLGIWALFSFWEIGDLHGVSSVENR